MGEKRVTLKDIAKEANVSTATVSYVLNYSEKVKISHETRLKIFDAAKRLRYVPNMTARSLASYKSNLVGIIINIEDKNKKSKIYQYYDLANEIQRRLHVKGYDVVFLPTKEVEIDICIGQKRSLDAIFIMDMDEASIRKIANNYFVPAIFIDGYVDDTLFCKLLTDYQTVLDRADEQLGRSYYVVMEDYSNKNVEADIRNHVVENDIFVNRFGNNLIQFLQDHSSKRGLVIGEMLGMQVEKYVDNRNLSVVVNSDKDIMLLPDTKIIVVSNKEKADKAVAIMEELLRIENSEKVDRITYIKPL